MIQQILQRSFNDHTAVIADRAVGGDGKAIGLHFIKRFSGAVHQLQRKDRFAGLCDAALHHIDRIGHVQGRLRKGRGRDERQRQAQAQQHAENSSLHHVSSPSARRRLRGVALHHGLSRDHCVLIAFLRRQQGLSIRLSVRGPLLRTAHAPRCRDAACFSVHYSRCAFIFSRQEQQFLEIKILRTACPAEDFPFRMRIRKTPCPQTPRACARPASGCRTARD